MTKLNKLAAAGMCALLASTAVVNAEEPGSPPPAGTVPGSGLTGNMYLDLHVDTLSVTCAFDTPVTGKMEYDNANERFDSSVGVAIPATVNLSYRNLATLNVSNDASFNSQVGAITAVNYGLTTVFGETPISPTSPHTGAWTLVASSTPAVGVISLLPSSILVAEADIPATAIYTEAFVVTCVE